MEEVFWDTEGVIVGEELDNTFAHIVVADGFNVKTDHFEERLTRATNCHTVVSSSELDFEEIDFEGRAERRCCYECFDFS